MKARNSPFVSQIDTSSDIYRGNYKTMAQLTLQLHHRMQESCTEGSEKAQALHKCRGQLLARERIELLLDSGSPFLELFAFGGYHDRKNSPKTGLCGVGLVAGREVMICSDLPTVRGGSKNEFSVVGGLRALEISIKNRLPLVNLIQTAGADLTQQHKVFHKGGATFRMLAERAQLRIPTISVVFGSSTAGGAYHPGMSDYIIMVKNQAKVYLGGPPLVRMATGEVVSHEELGGATMHSTVSGVSDFLAFSEENALATAREILASIDFRKEGGCAHRRPLTVELPKYAVDELLGVVSPTIKQPFDMAEVIARIVDGSNITFFKSNYGKTLVCCWAHIFGHPVGIIANNGVLFSDSSQKGTQFIHLCNQSDIPILFFHNVTGFMVGKQSEQGGLIKHGSLMVNAVSNSKVPHISIIMGASFGAGNYAMCGRAYGPRFLFSYPNAKCSVMGAEQLSGVLDMVAQERIKRNAAMMEDEAMKKEVLETAALQKKKYQKLVERQMDAYFTSGMLLDDGIIDPCDTRVVLGMCLSVVRGAEVKGGNIAGVSRL